MREKLIMLGWREWVSLPGIGVPAIKAKIDTGARTSSLHATGIEEFSKGGKRHVRFEIEPLQNNETTIVSCGAQIHDRRSIADSSGREETRYIIKTPITLGENEWEIEISLTERSNMKFRMLLGRTALKQNMIIAPANSYMFGQVSRQALKHFYS